MPRIYISKSHDSISQFIKLFESTGISVIPFPTIKSISVRNDIKTVWDKAEFDYIVFTSVNSVKYFFEKIDKFKKVKVAAIGKKTSEELKKNNINADFIPEEFSAKGLAEVFSQQFLVGKLVLIPSSKISTKEIDEELTSMGAIVFNIPIYDTILSDESETIQGIELLKKDKPELFAFTSPSSFINFISLLKIEDVQSYFENSVLAAIGNTTAEAIQNYNLTVNIIPDEFSLNGLVGAIINYYKPVYTES